MLLAGLNWSAHNRELVRSQRLWTDDGEVRVIFRSSVGSAISGHHYSIMSPTGESRTAHDGITIHAAIKNLLPYDPSKLTPLEAKCRAVEQRRRQEDT